MIWAEAHDRVIGAAGTLPWHLAEDLQHFKQVTSGGVVVMGRATWDSLPAPVRPLPGRRNLVLTRTPTRTLAGAETAGSPQQVLGAFEDFWVIGGAAIYRAFEPYATHIVRTRIDLRVEGDAYAPLLSPSWTPSPDNPDNWAESRSGVRFRVEHFERTPTTRTRPDGSTQSVLGTR